MIIIGLTGEWEHDNGYFGKLREGVHDKEGLSRVLLLIEKIDFKEEECIPLKLVSVLWYIPLFMQWQRDRVYETGDNLHDYDCACNKLQSMIELVLGVP